MIDRSHTEHTYDRVRSRWWSNNELLQWCIPRRRLQCGSARLNQSLPGSVFCEAHQAGRLCPSASIPSCLPARTLYSETAHCAHPLLDPFGSISIPFSSDSIPSAAPRSRSKSLVASSMLSPSYTQRKASLCSTGHADVGGVHHGLLQRPASTMSPPAPGMEAAPSPGCWHCLGGCGPGTYLIPVAQPSKKPQVTDVAELTMKAFFSAGTAPYSYTRWTRRLLERTP